MTVLVVGGGGREHALVAALARSPRRPRLLCAPGNPGTADHAENVAVAADDLDGLLALVAAEAVGLVVVGPEVPLVAGLADRLAEAGVPVVGPTKAAARLEGSKAFAKAAMERWGVPTAQSRTFGLGALDEARAYVENHPLPVVLKADGLAAGKGVVVAETRADALDALADMLEGGAFGTAGATVLVEAFLAGEEASLFVLTDGTDYVLLPAAQDHKRIGEGDTGPNTGGMGAYAPAPVVTPTVRARAEAEVVRPVLDGMRAEGHPYQGILYVGLMIDDGAPSVVEFNCRFGDPEAQVLLPLLASDPLDLFEAIATERLAEATVDVDDRAAACVVLASAGYPGTYEAGKTISGLDRADEHATVYHAGTARSPEGNVVTAGGRVLGITGVGDTLQAALDAAYAGADEVAFEGKTLRRDIGQKGLVR
ncbi:phosphoribosylamine--glycine ligase [Rubrivirga sp. IMCC45206]|uniref:phosphoribosylamine--glycine ligase n=1 Tax=Rubrivirga sp. IMCC45206 TaxID=3391614 RepID=UPI00399018D2